MTTTTDTPVRYVETWAWGDEHPTGDGGFVCPIDGRDVTLEPCPEHAPQDVPGLRLVDCEAEPRHLIWVHDREDYGVPCYMCQLEERWRRDAEARQCRHRPWRRWKLTSRRARWADVLGVISGYCMSIGGDGHDGCVHRPSLRGRRPYILGVSRDTWRCWRRFHRRGEPIGFGFCAKCIPCPECGSRTAGHNDGCREA